MAAVTTGVVVAGTAINSANQAEDAAKDQRRAGNRAIAETEAAREQARADLQPFREFGQDNISNLQDILDRPAARFFNPGVNSPDFVDPGRFEAEEFGREFTRPDPSDITSDPLYNALFDNATREITARNAARGKLNSGDTLVDLTNASLATGAQVFDRNQQAARDEFIINRGDFERDRAFDFTNFNNSFNQDLAVNDLLYGRGVDDYNRSLNTALINLNQRNLEADQLFNSVVAGQNAAGGQATATTNAGRNIADLNTQIGNTNAAGRVGAANAINRGVNQGIGLYDLIVGF